MTIDEIKELIQLVQESGVAELEVQRGDNRVRIRRSGTGVTEEVVLGTGTSSAALASSISTPVASEPKPPAADEFIYIKSPIVGTYYDSPSPGSPTFVKVGDRVSPGQALCIIESMKLMNEIESELSGIIVTKLVENGRPVEYGESLFAVQPV